MKRLTYEKIDLGAYVVTYKDQIVGELLCGDDGFFDYWPPKRSGALPSCVLSEISDELDRLNGCWRKQLIDYFENQGKKDGTYPITFTLERDASGVYMDVYCDGEIIGCITEQSLDTTSHKYVYTSTLSLTTYTEEDMRTILNMLVNLNSGEA